MWTGCATSAATAAPSAPYDSRPYRDKFTLFWSREDFEGSGNEGWLPPGRQLRRVWSAWADRSGVRCDRQQLGLYEDIRQLILAVRKDYGYLVR